MCFGCSKEPSHRDGSFEYPQHMFWLRKKNSVTHFYLGAWSGFLSSAFSSANVLRYPLLQTIWTQLKLHSVCFHYKILSEVHLNICSRHKKQMTFSSQKILAGLSNMGLDVRKPVFRGLRKTKAQSDQRLCNSLIGKYHIKSSHKRNFTIVARLWSSARWFESHFIGNP